MPTIDVGGVSPDSEIEVTETGGRQSRIEADFTQLDPRVMFDAASIMYHGAKKYGKNNWKQIPIESHINHALMHFFAWLAGDRQDNHLGHAVIRAMMAKTLEFEQNDPPTDDSNYQRYEELSPAEKIRIGLAYSDTKALLDELEVKLPVEDFTPNLTPPTVTDSEPVAREYVHWTHDCPESEYVPCDQCSVNHCPG